MSVIVSTASNFGRLRSCSAGITRLGAPPGNLHAIAVELHEMTKATNELNEIIQNGSLEPV
jgi:hypothetical protein